MVGAKSWIVRCPDRIAIDAKCSKALPLKIEITPETKFHLVAIAHGASEECKKHFSGGDGGLCINSRIIGKMHTDEKCEPFYIGKVIDIPDNFIHVFDDASYINVLSELDTIQDFLRYLDARQELLLTKDVLAESENDILAHHMKGVIKGNPYFYMKCVKNTQAYILKAVCLEMYGNHTNILIGAKLWKKAIFGTNCCKRHFSLSKMVYQP